MLAVLVPARPRRKYNNASHNYMVQRQVTKLRFNLKHWQLFDPVRYSGSPASTMTSRGRFDADPVAKALVKIGQPTIGPVSGILEDKDKGQNIRIRAALVLYNINSPNADAALADDLRTETDPHLRSLIEARLKARKDRSSR